jgi:hypothetical protein
MIDRKRALEIAQENAGKAYRDLSVYDVLIRLQDSNWHVDYSLKDKHLDGGRSALYNFSRNRRDTGNAF